MRNSCSSTPCTTASAAPLCDARGSSAAGQQRPEPPALGQHTACPPSPAGTGLPAAVPHGSVLPGHSSSEHSHKEQLHHKPLPAVSSLQRTGTCSSSPYDLQLLDAVLQFLLENLMLFKLLQLTAIPCPSGALARLLLRALARFLLNAFPYSVPPGWSLK